MLTQRMQDAINEQINNEFYSSYLYLAMSAYCELEQFSGCAQWMKLQAEEEHIHAMRLFDYLLARDERVVLGAISAPAINYESIAAAFEIALSHEQEVTRRIDGLYELAFKEKAFSALVELEWFIKEQVEEEKQARDIVHKFRLAKDDPGSLLDLDRELGQRPAVAPDGGPQN